MYRPCPQNPKPWGCTYRLVDGANGSIALRVNRGMPFPKSFILRTLEPYLTSIAKHTEVDLNLGRRAPPRPGF
jgi:hypothetical protein